MNFLNKTVVFCLDCGECLGLHKPLCAKIHFNKYPTHSNFLVKRITDPLVLESPEWCFKTMKILPNRRFLTGIRSDADLTESQNNIFIRYPYRTLR